MLNIDQHFTPEASFDLDEQYPTSNRVAQIDQEIRSCRMRGQIAAPSFECTSPWVILLSIYKDEMSGISPSLERLCSTLNIRPDTMRRMLLIMHSDGSVDAKTHGLTHPRSTRVARTKIQSYFAQSALHE